MPANKRLPLIDFFIPAADIYDHDGLGVGLMTYRQAGPVVTVEPVDYDHPPKNLPEYLSDTFGRLAAAKTDAKLVTCKSVNNRKRDTHSYLVPANAVIQTNSNI